VIELRTIGPPGTGKTTDLSRRIRAAVKRFGGSNVMVGSYTKAAAVELAGRGLPVPEENVGTLHALCWRALDRPTIAESKIKDWNEQNPGLQIGGGGRDVDDPYADAVPEDRGSLLLGALNRMRNMLVPEESRPAAVREFSVRWEDWKRSNDMIDFTDMIEICRRDLDEAPGSPTIAYWDEVQDFSPLLLSTIRRWGERMDHVRLAGDDDQTLYGFVGASPDALMTPEIPPERCSVLGRSWRVPSAVHALAVPWIERCSRRAPKVYEPRDGDPGSVERIQTTYKDPKRLLDLVEAAERDGKTIMVLASCSYMLKPLIKIMRDEGVPFGNALRPSRGDWNPLGSRRGTTVPQRILAHLRPERRMDGGSAMWTAAQIRAWVDHLKSKDSTVLQPRVKSRLVGWLDGVELLPSDPERYMREAIRPWFADGFARYCRMVLDGARPDADWMHGQIQGSKAKAWEYPLRIMESRGADELEKVPSLTIGTIHSVKGGEADRVVLFPDLSIEGMRAWLDARRRDEVIRQFYVGMTRARDSLTVCSPCGHHVNVF